MGAFVVAVVAGRLVVLSALILGLVSRCPGGEKVEIVQ